MVIRKIGSYIGNSQIIGQKQRCNLRDTFPQCHVSLSYWIRGKGAATSRSAWEWAQWQSSQTKDWMSQKQ